MTDSGKNQSAARNTLKVCAISGKTVPLKDLVRLDALRPNLADRIRRA